MPETLEFKISSGLKNIIGKELITNDLIAVFELVKNSYDAYADDVEIVFQNVSSEKDQNTSKLLIIDNGNGMSYNDIVNKWLFVGYSDKKPERIKPIPKSIGQGARKILKSKRIFAGAKGIGRFSCDRLGKQLTVYTKQKDDSIIHRIHFNWDQFEDDQKKEFKSIPVEYSTITKIQIENFKIQDFTKGTILEISPLNDTWGPEKILDLKRHLQRLINPASEKQDPEIKISLTAKEYLRSDATEIERAKHEKREINENKLINGQVRNIVFEKLGIKTTEINCDIDENGEKIFVKLSDKGEFIFSFFEKNPFKTLKNIKIRLFYLNRAAKTIFTKTMGIEPVNYGSIFLYKNRFRIQPCGDPDDDWLGLDQRKLQGVRRFLANRELIGRVEINGDQLGFQEVSSREGGLIKNENYFELKDFLVSNALTRLEKYVVGAIDWDREPSSKHPSKSKDAIKLDSIKILQKIIGNVNDPDKNLVFNENLIQIFEEKQIEKYPELINQLKKLMKSVSAEDPEYRNNLVNSIQKISKIYEERDKKSQELEKNLRNTEKKVIFLESITSQDVKLVYGLQHHIMLVTTTINGYLKGIKRKIERGEEIKEKEILNLIDKIMFNNQKVLSISKWIIKANYQYDADELSDEDLIQFIKQFIENVSKDRLISPTYRSLNISVEAPDNSELIIPFRPLEITMLFDNLLSNSIKANAQEVQIQLKKIRNTGLEIKFKDDGIGIPEENQNKIFEFGFTTTDGSGLGLHFVKNIVKKMNGTIEINPNVGKGTEFLITVGK